MSKFSLSALIIAFSLSSVMPASAAIKANTFGDTYKTVPAVNNSQTQIVFYRENDGLPGGANVYVDGEYQTSLLPGGFTAFCVAAGSHSLGAFTQDAPKYAGKTSQPWRSNLTGGETYFLKVSNGQTGLPQAIARKEAEQQLQESRLQIHALSRASSVQACHYNTTPQAYSLSSDVLFPFGKSSSRDITRAGHDAIKTLVEKIRRENSEVRSVQVVGHTDAIGSEQSNYQLGLRRAQTVRQLMVQAGMPARDISASSEGMNEPVVADCYGSRSEKISCMAPNRRVTILVDGTATP